MEQEQTVASQSTNEPQPQVEGGMIAYRRKLAAQKFLKDAPFEMLPLVQSPIQASGPDQLNAIAKIQQWRNDLTKPFLILYGPQGTGKTLFASRLFWVCMEYGGDFSMVDECEFREEVEIIATWRAAASQHKAYTGSRLARAGLLILDDFGQHPHNDKSHELFYRILNHRYRCNLKTVITTNLSPEQLPDAIGSKLASRLLHRDKRVLVKMDGPDIRLMGLPKAA